MRKEFLIEDTLLLRHPGPQLLLLLNVLDRVLDERITIVESAHRRLVRALHLIRDLHRHAM